MMKSLHQYILFFYCSVWHCVHQPFCMSLSMTRCPLILIIMWLVSALYFYFFFSIFLVRPFEEIRYGLALESWLKLKFFNGTNWDLKRISFREIFIILSWWLTQFKIVLEYFAWNWTFLRFRLVVNNLL